MMEVLKMKIFKKTILFITIAGLLFALTGCSPKAESVSANVGEVKVFADPAAEKILAGMNEGNYTKFSEDFNQKMKDALTEKQFKDIVSQFGKCESKEISGADKVSDNTRAFYKTKFSNLPNALTMTVVFSTEGGNAKVAGLFFK